MVFKSERNYDMSQFGWPDCKFTFQAMTVGEQQQLDIKRQQWAQSQSEEEISKAANSILDIMKSKFVRGEALDENGKKVTVEPSDFEKIPFDVMQKLTAWVTSSGVDEAFLAESMK